MHNQTHDAAGLQELDMNMKNSSQPKVAVPFLIGGDGRIYLNAATIKDLTVTNAKLLA